MLRSISIAILAGFSVVHLTAQNQGILFQDVAPNQMETGSGTMLQFENEGLSEGGASSLPSPTGTSEETTDGKEPIESLFDTTIPLQRADQTIAASVRAEEAEFNRIGKHYEYAKAIKNLTEELEATPQRAEKSPETDTTGRLPTTALVFSIELLVTLAVLLIAFQLSGAPIRMSRLISVSISVALALTLYDSLLGVNLLDPVRSAIGVALLLPGVKFVGGMRKWPSAVAVTLIARVASTTIAWFATVAFMTIFEV